VSPERTIRYSRYLGQFPRARTDTWVMVGQDGGQSIDLGAQTLLVFSDTLVLSTGASAPEPDQHADAPEYGVDLGERGVFRANCAAIMDGADVRDGLRGARFLCGEDGFPFAIVPATAQEHAARLRFWPAHGLRAGEHVYLYYLGIEALSRRDPWGFRNVGVGLARLDPATGRCERIRLDGDWRFWQPHADDFHFGVQVLDHGDHVYVFGSSRDALDVTALLGRVPAAEIATPGAYEFYDPRTDSWHSDFRRAGSLGPCGSDYSVSLNRHLGKYLMVYVDAFTKELAVRLADRPEGPYSAPELGGRLPHSPESDLIYLGFEHPKFARDAGERVVVSYCEPRFAMSSLLEVCFC
jgi:hypothetical protein